MSDMGARILLQFSQEALTILPQIINGYLKSVKSANPSNLTPDASNQPKSMEENFCSLEENLLPA
jgi:hypothetical protein